jgi:hypothetical protein
MRVRVSRFFFVPSFTFFQARYQACGAMSSDLVRLARCLHDPSIRLHLHATQVSGETGSRANCRLYGVVQLLLLPGIDPTVSEVTLRV